MLVRASGTLELLAEGPTSACELRLAGRGGWWILRLAQSEGLGGFVQRFESLAVSGAGPRDDFHVTDPEYGKVSFHADGSVGAEGRLLSPADWTVQGRREDRRV